MVGTLTTVPVTGEIDYPTGDDFSDATIRFELTRSDVDTSDGITISKVAKSLTLDSDGTFSDEFWPNSRGSTGSTYRVTLSYLSSDKYVEEVLGEISIPEAGAPHGLADLLAAGEPALQAVYMGLITQAQYDAFIATVGTALPVAEADKFVKGNSGGTAYETRSIPEVIGDLRVAQSFPTIAAFKTAVAAGLSLTDGWLVSAAGLMFVAASASAAITDLNGYDPAGDVNTGHFSVPGDGLTSAVTAFQEAADYCNANGVKLHGNYDDIYNLDGQISGTGTLMFDGHGCDFLKTATGGIFDYTCTTSNFDLTEDYEKGALAFSIPYSAALAGNTPLTIVSDAHALHQRDKGSGTGYKTGERIWTAGDTTQIPNSLTYSRDFSQHSDVGTPTVTANATGYDGKTNGATSIQDNDGSKLEGVQIDTAKSADSNSDTVSFFVEKASSPSHYPGFRLRYTGGSGTADTLYAIDHENGTVTEGSASSGPADAISVTSHNDDYWRVSVTITNNGTGRGTRLMLFPAVNADASATWTIATTGTTVFDQVDFNFGTATAQTPAVSVGAAAIAVDLVRPLIRVKSTNPTSGAGDEGRVDTYLTTYNARIVTHATDEKFIIQGAHFAYEDGHGADRASGDPWQGTALDLTGYVNPIVRDCHITRGYDAFIRLNGTISARVEFCTGANLEDNNAEGQLGYNVADAGEDTLVTACLFLNGRHGYTTGASKPAADSSDAKEQLRIPGAHNCKVVACRASNFADQSPFNTHHDARNIVFEMCTAVSCAGHAFSLRGINIGVIKPFVRNCGSGIFAQTEFDGGDTDDDGRVNDKTAESFTSVWVRDADIECHAAPFKMLTARLEVSGYGIIKSAGHRLVDGNEDHDLGKGALVWGMSGRFTCTDFQEGQTLRSGTDINATGVFHLEKPTNAADTTAYPTTTMEVLAGVDFTCDVKDTAATGIFGISLDHNDVTCVNRGLMKFILPSDGNLFSSTGTFTTPSGGEFVVELDGAADNANSHNVSGQDASVTTVDGTLESWGTTQGDRAVSLLSGATQDTGSVTNSTYQLPDGILAVPGLRSPDASQNITDDTAITITPPSERGILVIYEEDTNVIIAPYRTSNDSIALALDNGSIGDVSNTGSALSGTTGPDGSLNISARSGGDLIDIENRLGASAKISYAFLALR